MKGPALIIGFGKGPGPGGGMMDDADAEAKEDAAEALIDAVKDGDAAATAEAFKTLYDLCASHGDNPGSHDDEDMY